MSFADKAKNNLDETVGKAKEVIGEVTGNEKLEADGGAEQGKAGLSRRASTSRTASPTPRTPSGTPSARTDPDGGPTRLDIRPDLRRRGRRHHAQRHDLPRHQHCDRNPPQIAPAA